MRLPEDFARVLETRLARSRIRQGFAASYAPDEPAAELELHTRSPQSREAFSAGFAPIAALVGRFERLCVVGPRGSGRSTFLRQTARRLCRDAMGEGTDQPPVPGVPVPLEVGRAAGESLESMLDPAFAAAAGLLEAAAERGEAVFLIDGLEDGSGDVEARVRRVEAVVARWPEARFVVAADRESALPLRPLSFRLAELEPLSDEAIGGFARAWAERAERRRDTRAEDGLRALERAVATDGTLRGTAANPEALVWLCAIAERTAEVPRGALDLAERVVDAVLESDTSKHGEAMRDALRAVLERLAYDCVRGQRVELSEAADRVTGVDGAQREAIRDWLETAQRRAALVADGESGSIIFPDARLRAALATREVLRHLGDDGAAGTTTDASALGHLLRDELLARYVGDALAGDARLPTIARTLLDAGAGLARAREAASLTVAATHLLRGAGPAAAAGAMRDTYSGRAAERLALAFAGDRDDPLPPAERDAAAEALAWWGDPRLGDPLDSLAPVPLRPAIEIGRRLVTVIEFAKFVSDGGYLDAELWDAEGWRVAQKLGWRAPGAFESQSGHASRPVVNVSWYEADAFCRWLTARGAATIRLATQAEWQAVATHPDGPFPWGEASPATDLLNFDQHVGRPTAVGIYPSGASPGGHLDLAGNVWEWCRDPIDGYRVVVGGGWFSQGQYARSDYSYHFDARNRFHDLGFRLCRESG